MEDRHQLRFTPGPNEIFALGAAIGLIGKSISLRCEGREVGTGTVDNAYIADGGDLVVIVETERDYPAMFGLKSDHLSYVIVKP